MFICSSTYAQINEYLELWCDAEKKDNDYAYVITKNLVL